MDRIRIFWSFLRKQIAQTNLSPDAEQWLTLKGRTIAHSPEWLPYFGITPPAKAAALSFEQA